MQRMRMMSQTRKAGVVYIQGNVTQNNWGKGRTEEQELYTQLVKRYKC